MQHIPVNMRRLIKSTAQKAVYEIWKKQVKRQMPKCLLDVYKRQVRYVRLPDLLLDLQAARDSGTFSTVLKKYTKPVVPVSYTHLDVYKRQWVSRMEYNALGQETQRLFSNNICLSLIHI